MQHYLITNIDVVTLTGGMANVYGSTDVHLHASAIVLTRNDRNDYSPLQEAPCRIRLFGPDAAWPVTELLAASIEHTIAPVPSIVPGAIQSLYTLSVDRWQLTLATESQDGAPPDVSVYPEGTHISDVWRDLRTKVAEHWARPNMPLLQWVPANYARALPPKGLL